MIITTIIFWWMAVYATRTMRRTVHFSGIYPSTEKKIIVFP